MAARHIAGMRRRAVATGAGRQGADEINLREELDVVPGADRACLHEILACIAREPGAHEDVHHIVNLHFDLLDRAACFVGKRPREIGMAAIMVVAA